MSRLRSSRGSSGSSASRPAAARRPGVLVQAPKSDIFVVMLGISLGAIVLGCILMLIMLSNYNFSTKVSSLALANTEVRLA